MKFRLKKVDFEKNFMENANLTDVNYLGMKKNQQRTLFV